VGALRRNCLGQEEELNHYNFCKKFRLGELSFVLANFMICMMVLCVCLFNCNGSVVNSCICDQSNELD